MAYILLGGFVVAVRLFNAIIVIVTQSHILVLNDVSPCEGKGALRLSYHRR